MDAIDKLVEVWGEHLTDNDKAQAIKQTLDIIAELLEKTQKQEDLLLIYSQTIDGLENSYEVARKHYLIERNKYLCLREIIPTLIDELPTTKPDTEELIEWALTNKLTR